MNSTFDGDDVHKATSIHLQVDLQAMLESLPESATIYAQKNELDSVGATNNLRGLAAKIKFIESNVAQKKPPVKRDYSLSDKNIKDTSTGYASGETYFTMSYEQDGKVVGTVEYGEYAGEPNVKMIEVNPEYRRQGIGKRLLQELQKKYPDSEINFGMTTPDGTKLIDAVPSTTCSSVCV